MAKKALGKGLGALINKQESPSPIAQKSAPPKTKKDSEPGTHEGDVRMVDIESIVPSPLQPRKQFTDSMLDDLMDSIKQHGIIQPLIVRKIGKKLELIAGERRWRASKRLNLKDVPVIIREVIDRDVLEMALIENLQREDLNPIEEAAGYVRLSKEFGLKQDKIAQRVGKSRASVANAMRLLDLPEVIQNFLADTLISVGHAKAILAIKDPQAQLEIADLIIAKKLTVRAAEKLAQEFNNPKEDTKPSKPAVSEADLKIITKVEGQLAKDFGTKVNLHHTGKKGRIEIEYTGNADLNRILELLGVSIGEI
ncbi:ParB/RepB/Spo0J family partition protein [Rubritalea spongiae]|uniref:ParB/RepB/Spo0J family partition protein n=1 Tax=Rubritalea spongiae TaxID=430797 RepID=A0ABW5E493_9BACT